MKGTIVVETQAEYDKWISSLKPQYLTAHPDGEAKPTAAVVDTVKVAEKPVAMNAAH